VYCYCRGTVGFITTLPLVSHVPPISSQSSTLPYLLNLVQKISKRLFTRVRTHGSGIECKRSILPSPPCLEGQQRRLQIHGRQKRCVYLNGVSPCNRHRPFTPVVVTKTLLQDSARVSPVWMHEGHDGVYLGLVGENRLQVVKVVERQEWRLWVCC